MAEIKAKKVIFKNRDGEYLLPMTVSSLEIGDIGFTQIAIDETKGKRRKLNGQLIIQDQYQQFTNIIKNSVALNPDLACTEQEWQTAVTMSANGVCEKFVINDEAGTIRLPKYPTYLDLSINGAKTVSVYGTGKALSITNGNYATGCLAFFDESSNEKVLAYRTGGNSALPSNASYSSGNLFGNGNKIGVSTDGTKSGLTGSVTTESEQIKGTYFIQVATGAEVEDNIINEIELNNPFSLLDYKYSEYELNNLSWLRSEGQYNSKAVYPAVYELLLKIYNGTETKAGVSVKLTTETFTDTDFVLNTSDETFRLPIKVKLASGKAVVGNGKALGLTDGTNNFAPSRASSGNFLYGAQTGYGANVGASVGTAVGNTDKAIGVTTDPTKSGLELSDSDLYLYFYVGETVQNANLVNIGRIQETMVTGPMVDGQWVLYGTTISTSTAIGTYTLDLSTILPNDGFKYQVDLFHHISRGDTTGGTNSVLRVSELCNGAWVEVYQVECDQTNWQQGAICGSIIVDEARQIQLSIIASKFDAQATRLVRYRRLGTNQ